MLERLRRGAPAWLKEAARAAVRGAQVTRYSAEILAALYDPCPGDERGGWTFHDPGATRSSASPPIPPASLRMGYATGSDADYLDSGRVSAEALRALAGDHDAAPAPGARLLDWGCASGRVLRWFEPEARAGEAWGLDTHGPSIAWAKENLSPPFRFATCSALPHLPFPDGHFHLAWGLSVITHVDHLLDAWLLELRRVLAPGGTAVLTVHDEHSVRWFQEQGRPAWLPAGLDLDEVLRHELTVVRGEVWSRTYTFFRSDWLRRELGRYWQVLELRPRFQDYQSALVLRAPGQPGGAASG